MDICPRCRTTAEHDHDTCDGKPDLITVRWYTHEELEDRRIAMEQNKVYYVQVKRPHTR